MWFLMGFGMPINPSKSLIGFPRIAVVYPCGRLYFEFCFEYMKKAKPIGVSESRDDERVGGKGSRGLYVITPSLEEL